ncbi:MAG: 4-hydroxy-tetrahydrodipicolinate synthase [Spirochaetes bacterium]|nr:4-hydroxy-tetrahydrodipicolinate synthase [Spirochaetota bacterium]
MFKGSFVAIVTPLSGGKIDFDKLSELIEFQINNGTAGIVPCGTTGESATLTEEEHKSVIEFVIKKVNKRVPVIAGTGSNSTETAIKLTKHAQEAGADAALIITPYYNKPTQQGLYLHYKAIAENTDIPIILYNVPGRTAVNMLPETAAQLVKEFKNIVGLKDATGSVEQASKTLSLLRGEDFCLLSGDDAIVLPLLAAGGAGVISVLANIAPKSMSDMIKFFENGDINSARAIHLNQLALSNTLFLETNPIPVKAALNLMGKISSEIRMPLTAMSDSKKKFLEKEMKNFGIL